jgi:hypothetical protein
MFKKWLMLGLFIVNAFTLTSVQAQVPSGYQEINLELLPIAGTNNTQAIDRDNTYFDLWTFINFQDVYIDINGFTVVSDGQAINGATFAFNVQYGQAFELVYQDVAYYFAISELEISGLTFTVLSQSVIAFSVNGSGALPDPLEITINLPDTGVIPSPQASGGLLELLVGYGVYNPTGLLILFAVVLMIINITLVFLKVPSVVFVSTNLVVGSGFIFYNFIPVWASFIFLAVMALFLVLSFRGSKF